METNPVDLIAIGLIILAALLGFRSGALPQIGVLAVLSLPWFETFLRDVDPTLHPILVLTGLLLAVGLGETLGSALGRRLAQALGSGVLSAADRIGGKRTPSDQIGVD